MYTLLLILFLIVCIIMTVAILLQSSKGGGLAGAFGGASMGAVFGGRGAATFLGKLTTWAAVLYLVIALGLSKLQSVKTSGQTQSIVSQKREQIQSILPVLEPSIPAVGAENTGQTTVAQDSSKK
jgi:preprotein translocase subunit SecG